MPPPLSAVLVDCAGDETQSSSIQDTLLELATEFTQLKVASQIIAARDLTQTGAEASAWAALRATLERADIVMFGVQLGDDALLHEVLQRLRAESETPLPDTIGAVVIATGSPEADEFAATLLVELSQLGCVIPPGAGVKQTPEAMAEKAVELASLLTGRHPPSEFSRHDEPADDGTPRRLFGNLPTGSLGIDPATIESERRAAEEGRLVERRRMLDLTRREKGLPEKRSLPRPDYGAGDAPTP